MKAIGYIAIGVAATIALLILVSAAYDIVNTFNMQTYSPGDSGVIVGMYTGIIIRSLILGGVSLGLFMWGRGHVNPAKYSKVVLDADAIRSIYTREGLTQRIFHAVNDDMNYRTKSCADLDSIYHSINKEKFPERHDALLYAIKCKVEQDLQQGVAPYVAQSAPSGER